ncbi:MAG: C45 family peptidase [Planctomycetota bacterium]
MRNVLLVSLLALCLAPLAQAEVVAREGKGWLEKREDGQLVLHLKGSPYEMGFQHGTLLKEQVRSNMLRIAKNDGELGKKDEYLAYLFMRPAMHDMLRPHIPARFIQEMKGLAEGAGLDYEDVEAGNLFPAAFHCSGMALKGKATHDGSLYHVRILDYMTKLGLQDSSVVIDQSPEGGHRWLNVSFAGFIGSVTGMNEAQVAIGEMGGEGLTFWDGMPMAFLIRDALERAGTLEEAVEIFKTTPRTCEYYYVISDGKTRDAVGLWATPQEFHTLAYGQGYAMMQKFSPSKDPAAGNKTLLKDVQVESGPYRTVFKAEGGASGFIAQPPADTIVLSGPDRYLHFVERLMNGNYGKVDAPLLQELCKRPVAMKSNLHIAIFHPETLEVWVAVAAQDGSPACDQPYFRYSLADDGASKK